MNHRKQMLRRSTLIATLLLLAGCGGLRSWDGALGYQAMRDASGTQVIRYSDEARKPWESIEALATRACGRTLGLPPEQVATRVTAREELTREVRLSVPVPTGSPAIAGPVSASGGNMVSAPVFQDEAITRELKVRQVTVTCAAR